MVHASADFSTADVGHGYLRALRRQGHDVEEFRTTNRIKFFALGLMQSPDPKLADDQLLVSRLACEGIVVEALRHRAELVVVTAGGGIHPDGLELLNRAGFPIAVVFTESPYEDEHQLTYARHCGHVFCNDAVSARRYGWTWLPPAYDAEVHQPYPFDPKEACDVLIIGSGWPERQELLEQINWRGIDLRIRGYWPGIRSRSKLRSRYEAVIIENREAARMYSSAKICLNFHRFDPRAETLNPRAYELAACGAFQISDWRPGLVEVFGESVPSYHQPAELERLIRHYLRDEGARRMMAEHQRRQVLEGGHTFDDRAARLVAAVTGTALAPAAV